MDPENFAFLAYPENHPIITVIMCFVFAFVFMTCTSLYDYTFVPWNEERKAENKRQQCMKGNHVHDRKTNLGRYWCVSKFYMTCECGHVGPYIGNRINYD